MLVKAILTVKYEKTIDKRDKKLFSEFVSLGEEQALAEEFGIGWETPVETTIEYVE